MKSEASETRTVDCPTCTSLRRAATANTIDQRRVNAPGDWDPPRLIWEPARCAECFSFAEKLQLATEERTQAEASAAAVAMRRSHLRATGLPEEYVVGRRGVADLDDGPNTEEYRKARSICDRLLVGDLSVPWIYLCGDNGTNKSTLACCTLLRALEAGLEGEYMLWIDALVELRGLNRDDAPQSVADYVKRLVKVPRLVFDEIGFGTPTVFAAETIFLILEKRYHLDSAAPPGHRWTIFTSNRTVAQFIETVKSLDDGLMGARFERRIAEMSTEIVIKATP